MQELPSAKAHRVQLSVDLMPCMITVQYQSFLLKNIKLGCVCEREQMKNHIFATET